MIGLFKEIQYGLILLVLAYASWKDCKDKDIPNWTSIIIFLIAYPTIQFNNFITAGILFTLGYWLDKVYDLEKTNKWGMADTFFISVLALAVPFSSLIWILTVGIATIAWVIIYFTIRKNKEKEMPFIPVFLIAFLLQLIYLYKF